MQGRISLGPDTKYILKSAFSADEELKMFSKIENLLKEEEGASLAEYAILVSLIAVVCILGVTFFGSTVNTMLSNAGQHIFGS
jgi:pilus assembly protein Flp/PilA